jgi:hypothetical protein
MSFLCPLEAVAQAVVNHDHKCEYSCAGERPACENAWKGDMTAVFLGTVKSIQTEDVPLISDGERIVTVRSKVTFEVLEAFRGVEEKTISVTTGGDLCGFPFSYRRKYLVFADRHEGQQLLHVDICGGTKWEPSEIKNDLTYLRSLGSMPDGSVVSGTVHEYVDTPEKKVRRVKAVQGQKLTLEGTRTYSTSTDSAGGFRFDGVEPGDYVISFAPEHPTYSVGPDSVAPGASRRIRLANKGCAEVRFYQDPFATSTASVEK